MIFPAIQLKLKNVTTTGVRGGLYRSTLGKKKKKDIAAEPKSWSLQGNGDAD